MKYGIINVRRGDLERFLDEVKPEAISPNMSDKENIALQFDTYDDYSKAQKWVFSHYEFEIADGDNIIGCVYYEKSSGYGFCCYQNEHEEQGFVNPFKAEDALLEYFYNL